MAYRIEAVRTVCFSPEADLIAGIVITAIGVDTLRSVEHPAERPLALLPLIFGAHQLIETVVWWGVDGCVGEGASQWSTWLYLAIAFGLLPWFVPWAVQRIEPRPRRRSLMVQLTVLGAAVSVILMWALSLGTVEVADAGYHLDYSVPISYGGLVVALYVAATCGSLLLSSDRYLAIYGAGNLMVVAALSVLLYTGVISLWCVWAAITSVAIAVHLRRTDSHRNRLRVISVGQGG